MAFKREIWGEFKISEIKPVGWFCGKCFAGNLKLLTEKTIHSKEDRFSGLMKCTNPKCGNEYSCSGVFKYYSTGVNFEVSREYYGKKYKVYHPLFFTKSIRFFEFPKNISIELERELDYAFGHFWNDFSSCTNAIRRSVEVLLNDINVVYFEILDQRIKAYQKQNKDIGDKLMSIKWIGNAGSHKDKPTKDDLLDAFEILEYCLEHLFPNHERLNRINNISDTINQIKNIRSKS
jgi:hypothetical protein